MTNYTLTVLARVISNIGDLKKPLTGGEKIPDGLCWKETPITRILKSSFNGSAFTSFMFCMSQADRNGGESWCTMKFAENCAKLKANVAKIKPFKYAAMLKQN